MYYHSRELKYVMYGKVYPVWTPNNYLDLNYKWLGQFCGYAPQVWLSKSNIGYTGFKNKENKYNKDDILFGFDIIKGFSVKMEPWEYILNAFHRLDVDMRDNYTIEQLNNELESYIRSILALFDNPTEELELYELSVEGLLKELFKDVDQVVIPSLNLKTAKKIICRTDLQKKKLRKMGFIEDRITVKKLRRNNF